MLKYLSVGIVKGVHGIKGELKVSPLTNDIKRFDRLDEVFVDENGILKGYRIKSVRYVKDMVYIMFDTINSRTDAASLVGCYLKVDRENAVGLDKDEYFICDIIGLKVMNIYGKCLGTLDDVLSTQHNDVYVVKTEDKDILIPALKQYIKEIDLKKGLIIVDF